MSLQDSQQRREALKQQMALAAQHLLAEPDKHVGPGLRLLLGCAADRDGTVVRLALLSLLAVFKDLLPGYRIRSLTEEEQEVGFDDWLQSFWQFRTHINQHCSCQTHPR
jgi:nucleolar complex protein 3